MSVDTFFRALSCSQRKTVLSLLHEYRSVLKGELNNDPYQLYLDFLSQLEGLHEEAKVQEVSGVQTKGMDTPNLIESRLTLVAELRKVAEVWTGSISGTQAMLFAVRVYLLSDVRDDTNPEGLAVLQAILAWVRDLDAQGMAPRVGGVREACIACVKEVCDGYLPK